MFHPIIPSKIHPGSTGRVKMTHGNSTILKLSAIGQTALSWSMESQKTSTIKPEKGFSGPKFHPNIPSESHFVSTSRVKLTLGPFYHVDAVSYRPYQLKKLH